MMHQAWSSIEEVPYCFWRSSVKFQGHTAKKIVNFDPDWAFPDYRPVAAFKSLRFALFKQLSPQNRSTRTVHRLLITFQIWFHLIYRSFDANHMENDQTVALHKKTDFVTHFSKNIDAILQKCFKTLFSVVSFWYLVWGLSTTVVLIYLKENTSKQVLHS